MKQSAHVRNAWDLALEVHTLRRTWLDVSGRTVLGGGRTRSAFARLLHAEEVLAHYLVEYALVAAARGPWTRSVVLLRGEQAIVADLQEAHGTEPLLAHARLIDRVVPV